MEPNRRKSLIALGAAALAATGITAWRGLGGAPAEAAEAETFPVMHTDEEWKKLLSGPAYNVLRHEGTEYPYTSPLNDEHRKGVFACAGCSLDNFKSDTKFDSHTGWPSFWQPIPNTVIERSDRSMGFVRTEVRCRQCGGHLGHVFNDGPKPTGLRYCMNGVALSFKAA